MTRLGKDRQARGTICGTVVPHTFQTTVPWNDLRGTVERFCPKFVHQRIFQAISDGTVEPCERGALAPLSGRSVPGPSLRGTSGTTSSSSLTFLGGYDAQQSRTVGRKSPRRVAPPWATRAGRRRRLHKSHGRYASVRDAFGPALPAQIRQVMVAWIGRLYHLRTGDKT